MKKNYSASTDLLLNTCEISTDQTIAKDKRRAILALFIGILLAGVSVSSHAQSTDKQEADKNVSAYLPAAEGTYQLIFNSRTHDKEIVLTEHELMIIERLRKDSEVVYAAATYSDDIRVKILPKNIINSPSFKPVPKKYYKVEEDYEEYHNIRYIELQ